MLIAPGTIGAIITIGDAVYGDRYSRYEKFTAGGCRPDAQQAPPRLPPQLSLLDAA